MFKLVTTVYGLLARVLRNLDFGLRTFAWWTFDF